MSHQSDFSILDILQIFAAISLVIGSHLYSCKNHLLLKLEDRSCCFVLSLNLNLA